MPGTRFEAVFSATELRVATRTGDSARRPDRVFINLDMEEYHDLHLTVRLFTELLSEPEFTNLEAGIVLQAYLPDTFDALAHLAEFAKQRVAEGVEDFIDCAEHHHGQAVQTRELAREPARLPTTSARTIAAVPAGCRRWWSTG